MKKKINQAICSFLFLGFIGWAATVWAAKEWDREYHRLKITIEEAFSEPKGQPGQLGPYLQWMERKAGDREEVRALLEEAQALSRQNPNDEFLGLWVKKFSELLELAQASGENTVNGAVLRFMRIQDPKFPHPDDWQVVINRLREYGRKILRKAEETRFVTPEIRKAAKCMINYSIRDVEGNPYGFGVYEGRQGVLNIPGDRDFEADCEPRNSFTYHDKGRPRQPTDRGLSWIAEVREEARWWHFSEEEKDATDLMEEFYQDSLCLVPPNPCTRGHRYYHQLAEQYRLTKGLRYNEGFYATLYGKVELVSASGRSPARKAKITVLAPLDGQKWTTQTDDAGKFEIRHILLHRECAPFEITAEHRLGRTQDQFIGPLTKPDPSFRYEKNLEIRTAVWEGVARVIINDQIDWKDEQTHKYPDGTVSDRVKERLQGVDQYSVIIRFQYDPKRETLLSHSVQAVGSSTRYRDYYRETYGRCRKNGPWQVVGYSVINDDREECRLINRIGKLMVSISSLPGGSFFILSVDPVDLVLAFWSRNYSDFKEKILVCTQKRFTNPPVEFTKEIPFGVPIVFSQQLKDPKATAFQGEKRIPWKTSFHTSLRGSIPHHSEVIYTWSVWRN